jgi:predicted amidophosphoribosyltransferase
METQGRCWRCFGLLYNGGCQRCMHRQPLIHRQMAACEVVGPAKNLLQGIGQGCGRCIAAAASLMVYQWLEQGQLVPEAIVAVPILLWKRLAKGNDPALQLAQQVGKIMGAPLVSALKTKWDQTRFLTQAEFGCRFEANKKGAALLCDKRVLLIAPLLDDALFQSAAKELSFSYPGQIGALAFASSQLSLE